jgi:gluconolactonase
MSETIPAHLEVLDDRFEPCNGDSRVEVLHTGSRWAEGPV